MTEYEMYKGGMSIPDVSKAMSIPRSTLRFRFKKAGVLRCRAEAVRLAGRQGKLGLGGKGKSRVFTQEWKDNMSKSRKGKGKGLSLKPSGYLEITIGQGKGRAQHSVIMEEVVGRGLLPGECVHHRNGDRKDNRPSNLQLMTRSQHARLHALENNSKRQRDEKGRYV